jgi:beta-glucosidase
VPWGFRKLLNYVHQRYLASTDLAIYVTENGYPIENEGDLPREEALRDVGRQDYFAGYIGEMVRAHKEDGVRMGGYMAWSLLE